MFRLLRSFTYTSVLALVIALGPMLWFQHDRSNFHLRTVGEESNVALARLMATSVWPTFSDFLAAATKMDHAALRTQPATAALDAEIRRLLQGLSVQQVKIFAIDGNTVYSTDPSQIGERLANQPALRKAAGGGVSSELIERSSVSSIDGKRRSTSLIASFVPIHAPDEHVAGVFEISSDVTALIDKLGQFDQDRPLQLAIMFGALWAALFLVVHVGDRVLRHQYKELESMRDQVRAQADALEKEARQRAQAEQEVLMLREIEISQRALHSLVKNLSHELRTPLNAIIGFSQLIGTKTLDGPVPARTAEYAGHIETSAQHLLSLLNSILELAKAEAGELKLNENPVDVHVVADDCLRMFAAQAEGAGVALVNRIADNVGLLAEPDFETDAGLHARLVNRVAHRHGVFVFDRDRFLDNQVFARAGRGNRLFGVQGMRGADVYDVD